MALNCRLAHSLLETWSSCSRLLTILPVPAVSDAQNSQPTTFDASAHLLFMVTISNKRKRNHKPSFFENLTTERKSNEKAALKPIQGGKKEEKGVKNGETSKRKGKKVKKDEKRG